MAETTAEGMQAALQRQRDAFRRAPAPDHAERDGRLARLDAMVRQHRARFAAAIAQDFGARNRHETLLLEIGPTLAAIRHARRHLKRWMRPERRASSIEFLSVRNRVQYQPLGVVGIMVPWNYPLFLALGPLVDVLAAGNRALIKPSEFTPSCNAVLAEAIAATFAPEDVAVIAGGVAAAEAFSGLPFDHLVFTGSGNVGRRVMAASAPAASAPITASRASAVSAMPAASPNRSGRSTRCT
ncbi:aldehyde dehydrogenase family protein [Ferrovibrio xuzhouensis]|uniref:Aldehyde dehydrogenase family protein n=1 Tax=Ferrovibrio xuzhouensis TaxID=1576914 RepID=A0ABV7V9Q6_9PROT